MARFRHAYEGRRERPPHTTAKAGWLSVLGRVHMMTRRNPSARAMDSDFAFAAQRGNRSIQNGEKRLPE